MTHIGHVLKFALGLSLVACTMEDRGQGESRPTDTESAAILAEETPGAGALGESGEARGPTPVAAHHHHKRGRNCGHGWWATDESNGHHHHKRGTDCSHGVWATDNVNGHHHHKRGDDCPHGEWATTLPFQGASVDREHFEITEETFSDDPSVQYDLSNTDRRSYEEIEAELARMQRTE
jgi:hypothetical protein